MKIEDRVLELIQKPVEELGFRIDEIVYELEGQTYFLRVVIDKDGIVNLDDCVSASKVINPLLDEKDLIEENYILDVCSKEKGSDYNA